MDKHGLTLMEVIISALILAITVGGMLLIFSTEKGVVARTGRQFQAMEFGRQTLEELKNAVGADTWPDDGDLGTVDSDIDDPISPGDPDVFRDKFDGTRTYRVTNIGAGPNYKEVTVTVDWTEPVETQ